jgi:enolase-phosphatase E1
MIKAIITDIEGTTSSISFVKDVLFPYAAQKLPDYVRANCNNPAVQEQLQTTAQLANLPINDIEALIQQLLQWIREDKKITPLKALQGMIWQHGYEQGAYKAHVYADAVACLRAWHAQGLKLFVYSSGSIHAQKLFFKYSEAGDLTALFTDYFDTTSGSKQETVSYRKIAAAIGLPASNLLFLSDIGAELDAAREAGLKTVWLVREKDSLLYPGTDLNLSLHITPHQAVTDFSKISL